MGESGLDPAGHRVWPRSSSEVEAVVRLAARHGVAMEVRGRRAQPSPRGVLVLGLGRMDRILELDPVSLLARVEAGVRLRDLEERLGALGFTLGPLSPWLGHRSLGGMLAERAAAYLGPSFGRVEADLVVALEAVLPDGSRIHTRTTPRSAAGPDFDPILMGSCGTLAVLTEAVLAVHPTPSHRDLRGYLFAGEAACLEGVRRLLRQGFRPAVVMAFDTRGTRRRYGLDGSLLVVGFEGSLKAFVEAAAAEAAAFLTGRAGARPAGEREATSFWSHRWQEPTPLLQRTLLWAEAGGVTGQLVATLGEAGDRELLFTHATPHGITVAVLGGGAEAESGPTTWPPPSHPLPVGRGTDALATLWAGLKTHLDPTGILGPPTPAPCQGGVRCGEEPREEGPDDGSDAEPKEGRHGP